MTTRRGEPDHGRARIAAARLVQKGKAISPGAADGNGRPRRLAPIRPMSVSGADYAAASRQPGASFHIADDYSSCRSRA
jgi:hypothetical protein